MIFLYIFIAIFIAWIWVDYYRLIDIYEKESLKYFIFTFVLGLASIFIVYGIDMYVINTIPFELNGQFINDFLYCVLKIGMVEEFAKTIPFIFVLLLFKKQLNEPIDYLAFICVGALGFSAAENFKYFMEYGPRLINHRAILSTVGHMFNTSLIAYGVIRYMYVSKKYAVLRLGGYFLLAALSHGFYDFWLMFEGIESGGWIVTLVYFLITVSFFAVILNNALNNSSFFTYKKVIDCNKLAGKLLSYYVFVFAVQFVVLVVVKNFTVAVYDFIGSIYTSGFIVVITCVRLSRFTLVKGRWQQLKIELPFTFAQGEMSGLLNSPFTLQIKGDSYDESSISEFYEEYFYLNPLSSRATYLSYQRIAYIEQKLFSATYEAFYIAKVYQDTKEGAFEKMVLKAKTFDTTQISDKYPIVAVLKYDSSIDIETQPLTIKDFEFMEWGYLKGMEGNENSDVRIQIPMHWEK